MSSEWISVVDAFPDFDRLVLVHYMDNFYDKYTVAFLCKSTWKWIEMITGQILDVDIWQDILSY